MLYKLHSAVTQRQYCTSVGTQQFNNKWKESSICQGLNNSHTNERHGESINQPSNRSINIHTCKVPYAKVTGFRGADIRRLAPQAGWKCWVRADLKEEMVGSEVTEKGYFKWLRMSECRFHSFISKTITSRSTHQTFMTETFTAFIGYFSWSNRLVS